MNTYRLLTKSNIDGIVSAILLKHLALIDDVTFVRESDMQEGKVATSLQDITVNLPYTRGVHLAFDYHDSSKKDIIINEHHIFDTTFQSASDVIYEHYHDRLKNNTALKELVHLASNETNHTLTTKERMHVYTQYEKIFDKKPVEA